MLFIHFFRLSSDSSWTFSPWWLTTFGILKKDLSVFLVERFVQSTTAQFTIFYSQRCASNNTGNWIIVSKEREFKANKSECLCCLTTSNMAANFGPSLFHARDVTAEQKKIRHTHTLMRLIQLTEWWKFQFITAKFSIWICIFLILFLIVTDKWLLNLLAFIAAKKGASSQSRKYIVHY